MDDYDWKRLWQRASDAYNYLGGPGVRVTAEQADQAAAAHLRTEIERDFVPRGEVEKLREALKSAHDKLHECTAVLTADDCVDVAAEMARIRTTLGGDHG